MFHLLAPLIVLLAIFTGTPASAEPTVRVFGPGGPAPAMKEAAETFSKTSTAKVDVVAGPTNAWLETARAEGDVIYSGSEVMMTDFVTAMGGQIAEETIAPLYLRPAAVLVRPGNPKGIGGLADLFSRDLKVLVVSGAGQQGLWEDMAGRTGDLSKVRALRSKIVAFATNSAAARQTWIERPDIDAWIIWTIWQVANPSLADLVEVESEYRIYRDAGVGLTRRGLGNAAAKEFMAFLQSPVGAAIFRKWGWIAGSRS
jgi:accessory colonization factor AcfC